MNQDQFLGMLRVIVPGGLAWAVGKGWIPAGAAGDVGAAVLTVAAAAWSYAAHTDGAKIAAVTALPDVRKIVTASNPTNPDVKAAASDASQPKVAPAP